MVFIPFALNNFLMKVYVDFKAFTRTSAIRTIFSQTKIFIYCGNLSAPEVKLLVNNLRIIYNMLQFSKLTHKLKEKGFFLVTTNILFLNCCAKFKSKLTFFLMLMLLTHIVCLDNDFSREA